MRERDAEARPEVAHLPEALPVNFASIPEKLKAFDNWVVWKYVNVDGEVKKPPFSPLSGRLASVRNLATWGSFGDARAAYETGQFAGVGIVLASAMGLVGIDIDHCIADGQPTEEARAIVSSIDSYAEASPSGTGIRVMLEGKLPGTLRRRGNVEMYGDLRYLTLTGHWIANTPNDVKPRHVELTGLYHKLFGLHSRETEEENTGMEGGDRPVMVYQRAQDNEAVLHKAITNAKSGEKFKRYYFGDSSLWEGEEALHTSQSEADFTFVLMLLYWTNDNTRQVDELFRQSGLMREKWERVGTEMIEEAIRKRKRKG